MILNKHFNNLIKLFLIIAIATPVNAMAYDFELSVFRTNANLTNSPGGEFSNTADDNNARFVISNKDDNSFYFSLSNDSRIYYYNNNQSVSRENIIFSTEDFYSLASSQEIKALFSPSLYNFANNSYYIGTFIPDNNFTNDASGMVRYITSLGQGSVSCSISNQGSINSQYECSSIQDPSGFINQKVLIFLEIADIEGITYTLIIENEIKTENNNGSTSLYVIDDTQVSTHSNLNLVETDAGGSNNGTILLDFIDYDPSIFNSAPSGKVLSYCAQDTNTGGYLWCRNSSNTNEPIVENDNDIDDDGILDDDENTEQCKFIYEDNGGENPECAEGYSPIQCLRLGINTECYSDECNDGLVLDRDVASYEITSPISQARILTYTDDSKTEGFDLCEGENLTINITENNPNNTVYEGIRVFNGVCNGLNDSQETIYFTDFGDPSSTQNPINYSYDHLVNLINNAYPSQTIDIEDCGAGFGIAFGNVGGGQQVQYTATVNVDNQSTNGGFIEAFSGGVWGPIPNGTTQFPITGTFDIALRNTTFPYNLVNWTFNPVPQINYPPNFVNGNQYTDINFTTPESDFTLDILVTNGISPTGDLPEYNPDIAEVKFNVEHPTDPSVGLLEVKNSPSDSNPLELYDNEIFRIDRGDSLYLEAKLSPTADPNSVESKGFRVVNGVCSFYGAVTEVGYLFSLNIDISSGTSVFYVDFGDNYQSFGLPDRYYDIDITDFTPYTPSQNPDDIISSIPLEINVSNDVLLGKTYQINHVDLIDSSNAQFTGFMEGIENILESNLNGLNVDVEISHCSYGIGAVYGEPVAPDSIIPIVYISYSGIPELAPLDANEVGKIVYGTDGNSNEYNNGSVLVPGIINGDNKTHTFSGKPNQDYVFNSITNATAQCASTNGAEINIPDILIDRSASESNPYLTNFDSLSSLIENKAIQSGQFSDLASPLRCGLYMIFDFKNDTGSLEFSVNGIINNDDEAIVNFNGTDYPNINSGQSPDFTTTVDTGVINSLDFEARTNDQNSQFSDIPANGISITCNNNVDNTSPINNIPYNSSAIVNPNYSISTTDLLSWIDRQSSGVINPSNYSVHTCYIAIEFNFTSEFKAFPFALGGFGKILSAIPDTNGNNEFDFNDLEVKINGETIAESDSTNSTNKSKFKFNEGLFTGIKSERSVDDLSSYCKLTPSVSGNGNYGPNALFCIHVAGSSDPIQNIPIKLEYFYKQSGKKIGEKNILIDNYITYAGGDAFNTGCLVDFVSSTTLPLDTSCSNVFTRNGSKDLSSISTNAVSGIANYVDIGKIITRDDVIINHALNFTTSADVLEFPTQNELNAIVSGGIAPFKITSPDDTKLLLKGVPNDSFSASIFGTSGIFNFFRNLFNSIFSNIFGTTRAAVSTCETQQPYPTGIYGNPYVSSLSCNFEVPSTTTIRRSEIVNLTATDLVGQTITIPITLERLRTDMIIIPETAVVPRGQTVSFIAEGGSNIASNYVWNASGITGFPINGFSTIDIDTNNAPGDSISIQVEDSVTLDSAPATIQIIRGIPEGLLISHSNCSPNLSNVTWNSLDSDLSIGINGIVWNTNPPLNFNQIDDGLSGDTVPLCAYALLSDGTLENVTTVTNFVSGNPNAGEIVGSSYQINSGGGNIVSGFLNISDTNNTGNFGGNRINSINSLTINSSDSLSLNPTTSTLRNRETVGISNFNTDLSPLAVQQFVVTGGNDQNEFIYSINQNESGGCILDPGTFTNYYPQTPETFTGSTIDQDNPASPFPCFNSVITDSRIISYLAGLVIGEDKIEVINSLETPRDFSASIPRITIDLNGGGSSTDPIEFVLNTTGGNNRSSFEDEFYFGETSLSNLPIIQTFNFELISSYVGPVDITLPSIPNNFFYIENVQKINDKIIEISIGFNPTFNLTDEEILSTTDENRNAMDQIKINMQSNFGNTYNGPSFAGDYDIENWYGTLKLRKQGTTENVKHLYLFGKINSQLEPENNFERTFTRAEATINIVDSEIQSISIGTRNSTGDCEVPSSLPIEKDRDSTIYFCAEARATTNNVIDYTNLVEWNNANTLAGEFIGDSNGFRYSNEPNEQTVVSATLTGTNNQTSDPLNSNLIPLKVSGPRVSAVPTSGTLLKRNPDLTGTGTIINNISSLSKQIIRFNIIENNDLSELVLRVEDAVDSDGSRGCIIFESKLANQDLDISECKRDIEISEIVLPDLAAPPGELTIEDVEVFLNALGDKGLDIVYVAGVTEGRDRIIATFGGQDEFQISEVEVISEEITNIEIYPVSTNVSSPVLCSNYISAGLPNSNLTNLPVNIHIGETIAFCALGFTETNVVNLTNDVTWEPNPSNIGNFSDGILTIEAPGNSANITAKYTTGTSDNQREFNSNLVFVDPYPAIEITPGSMTAETGDTLNFGIIGGSSGTNVTVSASSSSVILTDSANPPSTGSTITGSLPSGGSAYNVNFTTERPGDYTLTATDGFTSDTINVTVTVKEEFPSSLDLGIYDSSSNCDTNITNPINLDYGETQVYCALDNQGSDVTTKVDFISTNPDAAEFNGNILRAKNTGANESTSVFARITVNRTGFPEEQIDSETSFVEVNSEIAFGSEETINLVAYEDYQNITSGTLLGSIDTNSWYQVSLATGNLKDGDIITLGGTQAGSLVEIDPVSNTNKDLDGLIGFNQFTVNSSNEYYYLASNNPGNDTITIRRGANLLTQNIQVIEPELIPTSIILTIPVSGSDFYVGQSASMNVQVNAGAQVINNLQGVTFSSSNTDIAEISGNGLNFVGEGQSTITATFSINDITLNSSVVVTVRQLDTDQNINLVTYDNYDDLFDSTTPDVTLSQINSNSWYQINLSSSNTLSPGDIITLRGAQAGSIIGIPGNTTTSSAINSLVGINQHIVSTGNTYYYLASDNASSDSISIRRGDNVVNHFIEVNEPENIPDSLEITNIQTDFYIGESTGFMVELKDGNREINDYGNIDFSSSNTNIADVIGNAVNFLNEGQATITATYTIGDTTLTDTETFTVNRIGGDRIIKLVTYDDYRNIPNDTSITSIDTNSWYRVVLDSGNGSLLPGDLITLGGAQAGSLIQIDPSSNTNRFINSLTGFNQYTVSNQTSSASDVKEYYYLASDVPASDVITIRRGNSVVVQSIEVIESIPDSITLDTENGEFDFFVNQSIGLIVEDVNNNRLSGAVFTSSNTDVANVVGNGVNFLSEGQVTITASYTIGDTNLTDTITLTIRRFGADETINLVTYDDYQNLTNPTPLRNIDTDSWYQIYLNSGDLQVGDSISLGGAQAGSLIEAQDTSTDITPFLGQNQFTVAVDKEYYYLASNNPSSDTITIVRNGNVFTQAIEVVESIPDSITLDTENSEYEFLVNESTGLIVKDGSNLLSGAVFTSSNTSVADVVGNGVNFLSEGQVTITASYTIGDTTLTDTITLTVNTIGVDENINLVTFDDYNDLFGTSPSSITLRNIDTDSWYQINVNSGDLQNGDVITLGGAQAGILIKTSSTSSDLTDSSITALDTRFDITNSNTNNFYYLASDNPSSDTVFIRRGNNVVVHAIEVIESIPDSITLDTENGEIDFFVNQSIGLNVTDDNGNQLSGAVFTSSNTAIADVVGNGVNFLSEGQVTITASYNIGDTILTDTVTLSIRRLGADQTINLVTYDGSSTELNSIDTDSWFQITLNSDPLENGDIITLSGAQEGSLIRINPSTNSNRDFSNLIIQNQYIVDTSFEYFYLASNNPSSDTISIRRGNNVVVQAIEVIEPQDIPSNILLSTISDEYDFFAGQSDGLEVQVLDDDGNPINNVGVINFTSSNTSVADVVGNGVNFLSEGQVTITASYTVGENIFTDSISITVQRFGADETINLVTFDDYQNLTNPTPLNSIDTNSWYQIYLNSGDLQVGDSISLGGAQAGSLIEAQNTSSDITPLLVGQNQFTVVSGQKYFYLASNNTSSDTITIVRNGNVFTQNIEVIEPQDIPSSIVISIPSGNEFYIGESAAIDVLVLDDDGDPINNVGAINFASSNTAIADVVGNGVNFIEKGGSTITATYSIGDSVFTDSVSVIVRKIEILPAISAFPARNANTTNESDLISYVFSLSDIILDTNTEYRWTINGEGCLSTEPFNNNNSSFDLDDPSSCDVEITVPVENINTNNGVIYYLPPSYPIDNVILSVQDTLRQPNFDSINFQVDDREPTEIRIGQLESGSCIETGEIEIKYNEQVNLCAEAIYPGSDSGETITNLVEWSPLSPGFGDLGNGSFKATSKDSAETTIRATYRFAERSPIVSNELVLKSIGTPKLNTNNLTMNASTFQGTGDTFLFRIVNNDEFNGTYDFVLSGVPATEEINIPEVDETGTGSTVNISRPIVSTNGPASGELIGDTTGVTEVLYRAGTRVGKDLLQVFDQDGNFIEFATISTVDSPIVAIQVSHYQAVPLRDENREIIDLNFDGEPDSYWNDTQCRIGIDRLINPQKDATIGNEFVYSKAGSDGVVSINIQFPRELVNPQIVRNIREGSEFRVIPGGAEYIPGHGPAETGRDNILLLNQGEPYMNIWFDVEPVDPNNTDPALDRLSVTFQSERIDEQSNIFAPGIYGRHIDERISFCATGLLANGRVVDLTDQVTWRSSDTLAANFVDNSETLVITDGGQTIVSAKLTLQNGEEIDSMNRVEVQAYDRLQLIPETASVNTQSYTEIVVSGGYVGGDDQDNNESAITATLSGPGCLLDINTYIAETGGNVVGNPQGQGTCNFLRLTSDKAEQRIFYRAGSTHGTATIQISDGFSPAIQSVITVDQKTYEEIFIAPESETIISENDVKSNYNDYNSISESLKIGDVKQLVAYGKTQIGSSITSTAIERIHQTVTWESNDPEIVQIDPTTGLMSILDEGTTNIIATVGDVVSTPIIIEVEGDPEISDAKFFPGVIAPGRKTTLSVLVQDAKGQEDIAISVADTTSLGIVPVSSGSTMELGQLLDNGAWYNLEIDIPTNVRPGTYDINVSAQDQSGNLSGIQNYTAKLIVVNRVIPGDINGDLRIDLLDAIMALELSVGKIPNNPYNPGAGLNPNRPIGIQEAIYALRVITGIIRL